MIQKSFVMMKPDAVQRRLMGKILSRFEEKGLQIVAVKLMQIDEDLAKTHYGEHADKPFFGSLIEYIGEVNDLDIDSILNHNKRMGGCCGSARGKGPLTCGKPHPDHHDPNTPHNPKKCCGHRVC